MLDLNNLRKEKHEGLCKILDRVLVVLFAVFFILSLLPYYSVSEGEYVVSRGYGAEGTKQEVEAGEDDSWTLLSYCGFPYNHTSVEDWQATMYKANKKAIKNNEDSENEKMELTVPGITTKTVSIKQVGPILFLDIFAIIGIVILLLKKGIARALYSVVWGIIGVLCFMQNYLLNFGNTFVRPVMLAVVVIALVVSVVAFVFYFIDARSRAAYLKSVSAAYA